MLNKLVNIGLLLVVSLFFLIPTPMACVGRILYVGALDTPESKLMAEILVTLINERTGTNVKIRYASSRSELYTAFKAHDENKRIDIIVENTADALTHLQRARLTNPDLEYAEVKKVYEKDLGVIWLMPFSFKSGAHPAVSAPLIRQDVLTNFPLLPRILNKLSAAIDNETYSSLMGKINSGGKPKNVAKDFLRERKFI